MSFRIHRASSGVMHASSLLLASGLIVPQAPAETFQLGVVEVEGALADDAITRSTVERLDLERIRRTDRFDVGSAAALLPGVTLQSGGQRGESLLFVRGFDARQVPLFIDGIPVYVPYDGTIDVGRLAANGLSRIDVSKAWTSLLYGPNTLGGSVNLVTRKPVGPREADLRLYSELDNDGDSAATLGDLFLGTAHDRWYAQAMLTGIDRSHFSLPQGFEPVATEDGDRRENSGSIDYGLQLRTGFTPNATDEYSLSYFNHQGRKGTPPYAGDRPDLQPARFWRWPEYDKESVYFISRTALGDHEDVKVRLYWDSFQNTLRSFDDATYTTQRRPFAFDFSVFDDYTLGAAVDLGSTRIGGHELRLAANYKADIHRETDTTRSPQETFEDATWGIALEDRYALASDWTLGFGAGWQQQRTLRADNLVRGIIQPFPTTTREAVNLQFGAFHAIDETHDLHVVISRRTRFPTIKDRFSYRLGRAIPNAFLEPESSLAFELAVSGSDGPVAWRAASYVAGIEQSIQEVQVAANRCTPPFPSCFQLQNVGESTNRGFELSGRWEMSEAWALDVNYAFLDRENRSRPNVIPTHTPAHSSFASLEYSAPHFDVIATAQAESQRTSSSNGLQVAPGFLIGNLKGIWHVLRGTDLEFSMLNLADAPSEFTEGFPEPGRRFLIGFHHRM